MNKSNAVFLLVVFGLIALTASLFWAGSGIREAFSAVTTPQSIIIGAVILAVSLKPKKTRR